jgi:hypothetical protein
MAASENARWHKMGFVGLRVGHSADVRREVLHRLYAGAPDVTVEARYVAAAAHKIHIATARVTKDGDPVTIEQPKAEGIAWLPHKDEVLSAIVGTVHALRARGA